MPAVFVRAGIAGALVASVVVSPRGAGARRQPPAINLDHIPIGVANLAAAAYDFRALGFALKPGRPHVNRNFSSAPDITSAGPT